MANIKLKYSDFQDFDEAYAKFKETLEKPYKEGKKDKVIDKIFAPPTFGWKKFVNDVVPENKRWNEIDNNTFKIITFRPGYLNGDKSTPAVCGLGHNPDVHAMASGGTGAGKSAFLEQFIMTLCTEYSPNDLELWLADFKKVTFSNFLPDRNHPECLPHLKACACTSDPVYAESVITALYKTMMDRQAFLNKSKENFGTPIASLKDWNEFCVKEAAKDKSFLKKKWPRILLIIDELKAAYLLMGAAGGDTKSKMEEAFKQITNLGRAAGCHMLLSSQRVADILPSDVIAGSELRMCLRVSDKAISQEFIGTDDAAKIKAKFGQAYIKGITISKEVPIKFFIPYIAEGEELQSEIKILYDKAKEWEKEGKFTFRKLIAYSEDNTYPMTDIDKIYEKYSDNFKQGLFIFGEKMVFELGSTAPLNYMFDESGNNHMYTHFENYDDLFKFYRLIHKNASLEGYKIILNTQAGDNINLMLNIDTDESLPKETIHMEDTEFVDQIRALFEAKKAADSKTPCYVICLGWDKSMHYAIEIDPDVKNRLIKLLQGCSQYGIHFIFIMNGTSKFRSDVIDCCNVRACSLISSEDSSTVLGNRNGAMPAGDLKSGFLNVKIGQETKRCRLYEPLEKKGKELVRTIDNFDI